MVEVFSPTFGPMVEFDEMAAPLLSVIQLVIASEQMPQKAANIIFFIG
jgi:hypothetical protein